MDMNILYEQNEVVFFAARAALLGLALVAFAVAFAFWRSTERRNMRSLLQRLDESNGETRTIATLARELAEQIAALELRIEDRQQLAAASLGGGQRGYDLALQMARSGATAHAVSAASGVTRNEADLLVRLHNPVRQ
jgi:hypothetical protein